MNNNLAAVLSTTGVLVIFALYIVFLLITIINEKSPRTPKEKTEARPVGKDFFKNIKLADLRTKVGNLITWVSYIAMAVCFVMVFVVSIDVILRKLTGQSVSIPGSNEFSAYFLIVICMLSIPMLHVKKGHIWVNMFVDKFPPRFRSIWMGCILALESLLTIFFTYGCVKHAVNLMASGRTTDIINLPMWPFALICAFGFFEFFVLLAIDTAQLFVHARKGTVVAPPEYRPEDASE